MIKYLLSLLFIFHSNTSFVHSSSRFGKEIIIAPAALETIYEGLDYYGSDFPIENDPIDKFDELPSFVKDEMTRKDLIHCFLEIIMKNFLNPIEVIYSKKVYKNDFSSLAMLMSGVIRHDRLDIFKEMIGLWGYFISIQRNPDLEALTDLKTIIKGTSYLEILDELLMTCKSLNLLSRYSINIVLDDLLENFEKAPKLSLKTLRYLFNIDKETVKKVLTKKEFIQHGARLDFEKYMIKPFIFKNLMT